MASVLSRIIPATSRNNSQKARKETFEEARRILEETYVLVPLLSQNESELGPIIEDYLMLQSRFEQCNDQTPLSDIVDIVTDAKSLHSREKALVLEKARRATMNQ